MLKKIIEIIADIVEYIKNYQLIKAGEDKIKNDIIAKENNNNKRISDIQNHVDTLSPADVERMLGIKIIDK